MNIIILQDSKGFRKVVEVARFTPDYRISETKPLTIYRKNIASDTVEERPQFKEIVFYPEGEPKTEYGTNIWLYRQRE